MILARLYRAGWVMVTGINFGRVLGQESGGSGGSTEWVNYVLNGGPFAVVVFLVVTDRLTTPGERDRLRTELTAAHEREATINDNLRQEIVPALTKNIDALEDSAKAAEKLATTAEKLDAFMANAERKLDDFVRNNPPTARKS